MTRTRHLIVLLVLLVGCTESLAPASLVTDFRAVAALVEVVGDPSRANPSADQEIAVSILSIDEGAPASAPSLTPGPLQWSFVACLPLPTTIGPPLCSTPIEPCNNCVATPPDDALAEPVDIRFQTPSEEALDAAEASSVLLQGIVCSNGRPSPDALFRFLTEQSDELEPCEGPPTIVERPIEGRFVTVVIPIESDPADPNLQPTILEVLFDGARWPPPYDEGVPRTAPATGCAQDLEGLTPQQRDAHPRAGDDPSTIDLFVTQDSLQPYVVDGEERIEEIQVSWLADGGALEQSFSFITDPARSVLTQWRPSSSAPATGELVRFYFVVRDGRGGTNWVERGLCVRPSDAG